MSQVHINIKPFGVLPDKEGFAGMYAGVIGGKVFCMGGANFPDKKPWEGGTKIWYDDIYMLHGEHDWVKLQQKMPVPLGYGISLPYKDQILLIGGYNKDGYHNNFYACNEEQNILHFNEMTPLPTPLANMTGGVIGDLLIVTGGTSSATGEPLSVVLGYDMKHSELGWFNLPAWPGPSRTQPVSSTIKNHFYLFSGETIGKDASGNSYRKILTDVYAFTPIFEKGKWSGYWEKLKELEHGVSASASIAPVFNNRYVVFWGGLDSTTARWKDPITHPGFPQTILIYDVEKQTSTSYTNNEMPSPVTLPSVKWKNKWLFISGEKRPGIRTNTITALEFDQH